MVEAGFDDVTCIATPFAPAAGTAEDGAEEENGEDPEGGSVRGGGGGGSSSSSSSGNSSGSRQNGTSSGVEWRVTGRVAGTARVIKVTRLWAASRRGPRYWAAIGLG